MLELHQTWVEKLRELCLINFYGNKVNQIMFACKPTRLRNMQRWRNTVQKYFCLWVWFRVVWWFQLSEIIQDFGAAFNSKMIVNKMNYHEKFQGAKKLFFSVKSLTEEKTFVQLRLPQISFETFMRD